MLHYFDVQDSFMIGAYTVIAGRASVFFTHYLDVLNNKQATKPISIGDYCMIGSNVHFAPGASIADCCVVGMAAVVAKPFTESFSLIAGNPAQVIKKLPEDAAYFRRTIGWIGEFAPPPTEIRHLVK
jgi:acetyltransferase-like isoleucine patch superfamily enzyme